MPSKKVIIYTAVAGDVGALRAPPLGDSDSKFVCFTDNMHIQSNGWELRPLPLYRSKNFDYVRSAKDPKIRPHLYFPNDEISVWVDENHDIIGSLSYLAKKALDQADIAMFAHPENRTDIFAEAEACIEQKKDNHHIIRRQVEQYKQEGMPSGRKILSCSLIVRRHNDAVVKQLSEQWWDEIINKSFRDQLSFDYICWKSNIVPKVIIGNGWKNEYVQRRAHDRNLRLRALERSYNASECNLISYPQSGDIFIRFALREYFKLAFQQETNLDIIPTASSPGVAFRHDYMEIYYNSPGVPEIVFPEILLSKPLIILTRDPKAVLVSNYQKNIFERNLNLFDIDRYALSSIYGIERQLQFVEKILDLFDNHPGPRHYIHFDALCNNPEVIFSRLVSFLVGVRINQDFINRSVAQAKYLIDLRSQSLLKKSISDTNAFVAFNAQTAESLPRPMLDLFSSDISKISLEAINSIDRLPIMIAFNNKICKL